MFIKFSIDIVILIEFEFWVEETVITKILALAHDHLLVSLVPHDEMFY